MLNETAIAEAVNNQAVKILCETDFYFFINYVFKEYYGVDWINNSHHDEIIALIYAIEAREIGNAVVNIPPRYGKTELVVILWICWTLIRNARAQFIHVSYSDELALGNSAKARDILKSPCIQRFWPIKMRDSADSKGLWLTEQGGGLKAGAAGGAVTGFGAGVTSWEDGQPFDGAIIVDDPLKADDAKSEAQRTSVNERLSGTLHSRKNHPLVPIVVVMQRLHEDDASGYALSGRVMGESFHHLKIPALQPDGNALWERKHTAEKLKAMEQADRITFAGQYQQEPYTPDGEVFQLGWFGRYDSLPHINNRKRLVVSLDTAYKPKTHNDPSCALVFVCTSSHAYLADVMHGRWEYPDLRKRVFNLAEDLTPDAILIEDKASGQSLIQEFRKVSNYPVIAIDPEGDKETRARTSADLVQAGRIMLPNNAAWLAAFEKELVAFPNGSHDDQVDALSQFIEWWKTKTGNQSFLSMMDELYG